MMDGNERLDLTYFATGAWQHVFVKTSQEEDAWVYKIPAAFGYILPADYPKRALRPRELYARSVRLILIDVPRGLNKRVHKRLTKYIQKRGLEGFKFVLNLLAYSFQVPCALGEKLLVPYLKRTSSENFEAMLKVIEYICLHGLADVLLPCKIVRNGNATLRVDGATIPYRGSILVQRKADLFFEGCGHLKSFKWQELIEAQHRLWRFGVAFLGPYKTIGLRGWAVLDGHLHLADTSSLTTDFRLPCKLLTKENLDRLESGVLRRLVGNDSPNSVQEYFRFIRMEVNQDKLGQLWRADLDGKIG